MANVRRFRPSKHELIWGALVFCGIVLAYDLLLSHDHGSFDTGHAWAVGIMSAISGTSIAGLVIRSSALKDEVRRRQRAEQNLQFAVDQMPYGLCMFDAQERLVASNKPYAEMYHLDPRAVVPGMTFDKIIDQRIVAARLSPEEADMLRARKQVVTEQRRRSDIIELQDGWSLLLTHCPLPDGGWVATHQDITEMRRTEARINYLARHDTLTGLPNRVLFHERITDALLWADRGGIFAVLCLDLDGFKQVNDRLGHSAGDTLLREVAERLRSSIRDTDTVARLGGDEFAIIQCSFERPQDAAELAERVLEAVSQPYRIDGQEVSVSTSIGIAIAPGDGRTGDALLKHADLALYRAKADGRRTFRCYENGMDARIHARQFLETELRQAIKLGQFVLHYQPVFDLNANAISGFEALLRWQHPTRGTVPPSDFIRVAEESGLIVPIGDWVLRTACMEAATWPCCIRVAVNLSPVQVKQQAILSAVTSALAATGLRPELLELEVTETVLLEDDKTTAQTLRSLRELGTRIVMDDFGTGYSSLSYLRSFPFDKIKIDRSFVRDLADKQDCRVIIRAIADLARNLGIGTTAEGVETDEQMAVLREEGCSEAQGYLISPPQPASCVLELLKRFGHVGERRQARQTARAVTSAAA